MSLIAATSALWLSVGLGIYTLLGIIGFVIRRRYYPIVGRVPVLVCAIALVLSLHLITRSLLKVYDGSCKVKWVLQYIFMMTAFNLFAIRCYILFVRHQYTYELIQMAKADTDEIDAAPVPRWWSDRPFMRNLWFIVSVGFGWFVVSCLPLFVVLGKNDEDDYCDGGEIKSGFFALTVIHILLFMGVAWKLRKVVEGYHIKPELKMVAVSGIIGVIGLMTTSSDTYESFFVSGWIPFFMCNTLIVWIPLVWTFKKVKVAMAKEVRVESLRDLFALPEGLQSFKLFLQSEFSVENLIFYQTVMRFKHQCRSRSGTSTSEAVDLTAPPSTRSSAASLGTSTPPKQHRHVESYHNFEFSNSPLNEKTQLFDFRMEDDPVTMALRIYNQFIAKRAPSQVNLPADITSRLHRIFLSEHPVHELMKEDTDILQHFELTSLDPVIIERKIAHVFDEAARNTFELLSTDSYMRFRSSALCRRLTDKVKSHNLEVASFKMVTGGSATTADNTTTDVVIRVDSDESFDNEHILKTRLSQIEPALLDAP